MSKLGFIIPEDLEKQLRQIIPWGSKGAVIIELLWQLADRAKKNGGRAVYTILQQASDRDRRKS